MILQVPGFLLRVCGRVLGLLVTDPQPLGIKVRSRLELPGSWNTWASKEMPPKTNMTMEETLEQQPFQSTYLLHVSIVILVFGGVFNSTHFFGQQTLPLTYMIHLFISGFLSCQIWGTWWWEKTPLLPTSWTRPRPKPSGTKPYTWMSQDVSKWLVNGL